jgi:hypothetical protein
VFKVWGRAVYFSKIEEEILVALVSVNLVYDMKDPSPAVRLCRMSPGSAAAVCQQFCRPIIRDWH